MPQLSIHVDQIAVNDWVVREKTGRERGHYPTQHEPENVGRLLARKRKAVLFINGRADTRAERSSRRWFDRLFGG